MPYTPPPLLSRLKDVELIAPSVDEILTYGSSSPGKWSDAPPPAGTTVGLPGDVAQSGAVEIVPGNNITVTRFNRSFSFSSSPQAARSASVFIPGVLAAATVQELAIPNPVLTEIDAYFKGAPAGVTGASCANLVIAGSGGGSVEIPFSVAGQNYYSTGQKNISSVFGELGTALTGSRASGPGQIYGFIPSANGFIGAIAANVLWNSVPPDGVAVDKIRLGIVVNPGALVGLPDQTMPEFATCTNGLPAYVDLLQPDIGAGGGFNEKLFGTLPGLVAVAQNQAAYVAVLGIDGNGNMLGNIGGVPNLMADANATFSGNISGIPATWGYDGAGGGSLWEAKGPAFPTLGQIWLYSSASGAVLTGTVQVSVTMTGAPATPGSDLNVFMIL